jgi:hypothetical protein
VHGGTRALGVVQQDAGQLGARHAHGGGVVGAAGLDVRQVGDDRRVRTRSAQRESFEGVAGGADVVPRAQRVERAQGIALQRDPRAERAQFGSRLEDVDVDAGPRKLYGCGQAYDAGAGDGDFRDCGHVRTSLFCRMEFV